jgi:hypothetical protein
LIASKSALVVAALSSTGLALLRRRRAAARIVGLALVVLELLLNGTARGRLFHPDLWREAH